MDSNMISQKQRILLRVFENMALRELSESKTRKVTMLENSP